MRPWLRDFVHSVEKGMLVNEPKDLIDEKLEVVCEAIAQNGVSSDMSSPFQQAAPSQTTGPSQTALVESTSDSMEDSVSFSQPVRHPTATSLLLSTFLSLTVVLVLLMALRLMLPSMLEFSRYAWHRGQLRAEYEMAGQQLQRISMEGLGAISQTVAKRVSPSVVHIMMSGEVDETPRRAKVGQGSGIIVDARGYILTNLHVLDDGSEINVVLADERTCKAELVGFDKMTDLAVLKINANEILPISWGDSDFIEVGSPVWAVGSPFGLTGSVTFGILSSKHRLDLAGTSYEDAIRNPFARGPGNRASPQYSDLMQSDVAVNPGNSGGPLLNGRGEMIGINTAIIGESYRGVSFSIPSNVAKIVFNQILESGRMRRGYVGIELVKAPERKQLTPSSLPSGERDASQGKELGLDDLLEQAKAPVRGALIRKVVPNMPGDIAGLENGDIILEMNGLAVKGVADLIFEIGKTPVGDQIEFTVVRNDDQMKLRVKVAERPDQPN